MDQLLVTSGSNKEINLFVTLEIFFSSILISAELLVFR